MDNIFLATLTITIGLLIGLGYYLSRLRNMIDNIGYMVATMMDHFEIPGDLYGDECDGCEHCEATLGQENLADVRKNDTLLNPYPQSVESFRDTLNYGGFGTPDNQHPRYGWQSWDGEQE